MPESLGSNPTVIRLMNTDKQGPDSGPNRPAADIGSIGGVIFQICQILCAYYAFFGTHGLLKLIVRKLELHRNSGFSKQIL